jgi:hypothetical protein
MATAAMFLDSVYGELQPTAGNSSRAQTPMLVGQSFSSTAAYPPSINLNPRSVERFGLQNPISALYNYYRSPKPNSLLPVKDASYLSVPTSSRQRIPRPSALPQSPNLEGLEAPIDRAAEYVLVVSMYEVYNDRIFDLLSGTMPIGKGAAPKRRAMLFKSTEMSTDRKVVAGLRKVVCCTLEEALMVLETGLVERKVAGTGSNAVSSRSHGFFCVEVKKRNRVEKGRWEGSTLTIVDLAGE